MMKSFSLIAILVPIAIFCAGCSDDQPTQVTSGDPSSVAIAPISYDALWVVNGGSNSISVINTETDEVTGTIALRDAVYPHHISMSGDHKFMLVAIPGTDLSEGHGSNGGHGGHMMDSAMMGAVMVMDAITGATQKALRCAASNHNAAYSPDGSEIWTCQAADMGSVLVLDPNTFQIKRTIAVGSMPLEVTFSADHRSAFVTNNGSNNVTVIDVGTKEIVATLPVGDGPVGAWPGTNNVMYVDNETSKSLTAIDASTRSVVRVYDLGFTPAMALVGPDGRLWVTDADNGKVVFYRTDADERLGELTTGTGAHAIAFSGDGSRGYITNQSAGTVSIIDVATLTQLNTIPVGSKPNGLVWRGK